MVRRVAWFLPSLLLPSLGLAAPDRAEPSPRALVLPADARVATPDPLLAARTVLGTRADLSLRRIASSLTGEHVRFQRLASDGTPLLGASIGVHFGKHEATGFQAKRITQSVVDLPVLLSGQRRLDEPAARAAALAASPGEVLSASPASRLQSVATARAGWRVVVKAPRHEWEVFVDGETGTATVLRDLLVTAEGSAFVYKPNPITSSGDLTLRDNEDADSATLKSLRYQVTLHGLDGSGFLRGEWVDSRGFGMRAEEPGLVFDYERADDRFEEVNAYHHVDRTQRYLQSLGYVGTKGILEERFEVISNGRTDDNSHYSPSEHEIVLGSGGVDDGEDGDVIVHEYGHAMQFAITPGWTSVGETGALGEAFGDLIAYLVPNEVTPNLTRACLAPWDATAYSASGCLRRVDGTKHYPEFLVEEPHEDGEIFTGAFFDLIAVAELSAEDAMKLLLEHQYLMPDGGTLPDAASALVEADQALFAGAHREAIRRVMTFHGLLADIEPEVTVGDRTAKVAHERATLNPPHFTDQTVSFTEEGAEAIVLHFDSYDMEAHPACKGGFCDRLYFYDGEGRLYGILGGKGSGFGPVVKGDTVILRWVTNGENQSKGFTIDRIETYELGDGQASEDDGCSCRVGASRHAGGASLPIALVLVGGLLFVRTGAAAARRRRSRSR
jgi:hypothetical protein